MDWNTIFCRMDKENTTKRAQWISFVLGQFKGTNKQILFEWT